MEQGVRLMRSDYGNLRRRTRDAGWQWMFIGVLMGIGFAMVACVGGYALGAITFPALEEDTATPRVLVEPNATEMAALAQQTLDAMSAQQTLVAQAAITEEPLAENAGADTESAGGATPSVNDEQPPLPTPTPSLLPGNGEAAPDTSGQPPSRTETDGLEAGDEAQLSQATEAAAPAVEAEAAALAQDTPVVGTPPVDESPAELGLPQPPAIPPELDAIKTEMATVTGGTFMMGTTLEEAAQAVDECALYDKTCDIAWAQDSTPTHQTTVDTFDMEIYEVSVAQYVTFLNWKGPNSHKTGCQGQPCVLTTTEQENSYIRFNPDTQQYEATTEFYTNHPVTFVTWMGAVEYCDALNRRLPTEAEWERAARGPQNNYYPWGFEFDPLRASTAISEQKGTVPVTSFVDGASPYDILNMAGNVEEWVFDWYQVDFYSQQASNPTPNPKGPPTGTEKVLRGGSWDTIPFFVRSMHRRSEPVDQPLSSTGFRCAADATAASTLPAAPVAQPGTDNADTTDTGGAPTLAPVPTTAPAEPTGTLDPGT
jgi:formylglycine-generating enzyme required for sulfatase activity